MAWAKRSPQVRSSSHKGVFARSRAKRCTTQSSCSTTTRKLLCSVCVSASRALLLLMWCRCRLSGLRGRSLSACRCLCARDDLHFGAAADAAAAAHAAAQVAPDSAAATLVRSKVRCRNGIPKRMRRMPLAAPLALPLIEDSRHLPFAAGRCFGAMMRELSCDSQANNYTSRELSCDSQA